MRPYAKDLELYRGDYFVQTFRLRSRVWNPALNAGVGGWEPGDYRDLTGWTGLFQIRKNADDVTALANGVVTILDQTLFKGSVQYSLEGPAAAELPGGKAYYDVQLTDTSNKPRTFIAGAVNVIKDVSRA